MEWKWFGLVSVFRPAVEFDADYGFLPRYFLARILDNVGVTDNRTKNLINLANTCWGFINATALALTISRFKRRHMYLVSLSIILTNASAHLVLTALYHLPFAHFHRLDYRQRTIRNNEEPRLFPSCHRVRNSNTLTVTYADGHCSFIFLYSPAYNVAYNALTYSKCNILQGTADDLLPGFNSFPRRTFPFPRPCQGYYALPIFRPYGRLFQPIRQSHWNCQLGLEILYQVSHRPPSHQQDRRLNAPF